MQTSSSFELAPIWSRLIAKIADVFGVLVLIGVVNFPVYLFTSRTVSDRIGELSLLLFLIYLLIADGIAGQSIGKRAMRIAVIEKDSGDRCSVPRAFVRNVILWFLGPIDWLFALGRDRTRLGDRAAGTLVVKVRSGD